MAELTDDDILELADQLAKELDLDEDARNVITVRVQRLVWPPSPYPELHQGEHVSLEISEDGRSGTLSCVGGCARRWRVNQAPDRDTVFQALADAHLEYRTGLIVSEAPPAFAPKDGRRVSLSELMGRTVTVEVTDERVT